MFNPFKKKTQSKERTTNPGQLLLKALDFLKDNHYHILMPRKDPEPIFYMLDLNSINGMKRVEFDINDKTKLIDKNDDGEPLDRDEKIIKTKVKYIDKDGKKVEKEEFKFYDNLRLNIGYAMFYRHSGYFGKSASTAVLGGTKRKTRRRHRKFNS